MTDQSDKQTSIFSSYKGENKFWYKFLVKDERVTNTSEMQVALKEFINNALEHLHKYNIPKLKCEVLGHHLENLQSVLYELGKTPLDGKICSRIIQCSNPGKEPPSDELTSEQKQIKIDIVYKVEHELSSFPRLNFLERAFHDYFEMIEKTLKLIDRIYIRIYGNVTVGRYMKELAKLRCEREGQSIISECIEEIRQELEKYHYPRSVSQPINEFISHIENDLDKYEEKPPRGKGVEDSMEKLKTVCELVRKD